MSTGTEPSIETLLRAEIHCCGSTHTLEMDGGHIVMLDHSPAELERERILQSMGAPPMACERAVQAWRHGDLEQLPVAWATLRRALQDAIDGGDSRRFARLIEAGVDTGTRGRDGRPLLHLLHRFDPDVVAGVLASEPDLEAQDRDGRTALRVAIELGAVEVVEALCAHGADVTRVGPYAEPAIVFAAQRVWSQELEPERGVAIMHRLLDQHPGPFDARAIALQCAMAELPSSSGFALDGEQRFSGGPSAETIDEMQNYNATRLFDVAVKAEDEPLVHRLAQAGFAEWVGHVAPPPAEQALRELVRTVIAEGER